MKVFRVVSINGMNISPNSISVNHCHSIINNKILELHIRIQIWIDQLLIFTEKFSPLPGFEPRTSPVPSRYATNWAILAWTILKYFVWLWGLVKTKLSLSSQLLVVQFRTGICSLKRTPPRLTLAKLAKDSVLVTV